MRRLAAVVALVASMIAGCGDRSADPSADPPPSTTESPRGAPSTTVAPEGSGLVLSGRAGVQVVSPSGASRTISPEPAANAFGIGSEIVVFQGADPDIETFPPLGSGPVQVWDDGEVRTLVTSRTATGALLLDATSIDGAPLALISERLGGSDPEDTFEELVQVDLRDGTRTTLVRRAAWESGHVAARFLDGGDVVGLFSSEGHVLMARWRASHDEPRWTAELGFDLQVDLALRDGEITLVAGSFADGPDPAASLAISSHDGETGEERSSRSIVLRDPRGEIATGLVCRDWTGPATLVCGRSAGEPLLVDTSTGGLEGIDGPPGSVPTAPRPR